MQSIRLIVNINSDDKRGVSPQAHMTVNYKEWNVGPVHTDGEKGRRREKVWVKLLLENRASAIEPFWCFKWTEMKIKGFVHLISPSHVIRFPQRNTKGDALYKLWQHSVSRDAYGQKRFVKIYIRFMGLWFISLLKSCDRFVWGKQKQN